MADIREKAAAIVIDPGQLVIGGTQGFGALCDDLIEAGAIRLNGQGPAIQSAPRQFPAPRRWSV